MDFRLIALDLDGTTLNNDSQLTDFTKHTLESAIKNGIHVVIASGRAKTALPTDVLAINGLEYAITSNGSSIFSLTDGKRIYGNEMVPETVSSILSVIEESGDGSFPYEAFIAGNAYTPRAYYDCPTDFGVPERMISYVHETRTPITHMMAFIRKHIHEIEGMDLIIADSEKRAAIHSQLLKIPRLYITASMSYYLELADESVSKASALQVLARQLHLPSSQVIAFGDGKNDMEMLTWAGRGVAMKNAAPELLAVADDVALSNDEDGVAQYLQKYL